MAGIFPDRVSEGFFSLLRAGLGSGKQIQPLSGEEWDGVLSLAARQSVSGIICAGVNSLPESFPVPDKVILSLMADAERIRRRSALVSGVMEKALERFADAKPIVMKGPAVAAFYPEPELRESGDIDLYIPKGASGNAAPDGSSHIKIDGIDIDIHSSYFDLGLSPDIEIPSPEATLLMLSAHILKHAFSSGIGMRQICDIALAYRALDYNPSKLLSLWSDCGLTRWNNLLSSFIRQYLCIQATLVEAEDPEGLLKIVLEGGNFGHFAASRRESLSGPAASRKEDTLKRILRKAPFGLRYAPGKYLWYIFTLVKGNLKAPSPPSSF